jgi:hypothetical protein
MLRNSVFAKYFETTISVQPEQDTIGYGIPYVVHDVEHGNKG